MHRAVTVQHLAGWKARGSDDMLSSSREGLEGVSSPCSSWQSREAFFEAALLVLLVKKHCYFLFLQGTASLLRGQYVSNRHTQGLVQALEDNQRLDCLCEICQSCCSW